MNTSSAPIGERPLASADVPPVVLATHELTKSFGGTLAAKPGAPTAKAPKSTIATTKPTFTWSKAARAATYELRVSRGDTLQLKKTGLTKHSWKAVQALPKNVALTWKVRASNARGAGAWSRSLAFTIVLPGSAKAITASDSKAWPHRSSAPSMKPRTPSP